MDSSRTQLYACCTNSVIYHYDCHTYNPQYVNSYYGHRSSSYYIKIAVSGDDRYLLSGSGDRFAYIWELAKPSLPSVQLPGHTEEVTAVAWSPLDLKAISCGDDEQILIWDVFGEQEEESAESTIHCSAVPYDISKLTKAPKENSPLCDVEVLKSETPSVPQRRSSISLKNVATKRKTTLKCSSFSITQWFSPLDSLTSVERPHKRNTTPEDKISSSSHVESEPSKRRKSGEFDNDKRITGEVLSHSKVDSSVDCTVLLPDKTDSVVDSRILSPSKLNSVNDRVLSPSKANCMLESSETSDTRRVLNLTDTTRSEVDEPYHNVTQNKIDKENLFCYEISPTRILDVCYTSEPENCVPKGNNSEFHKISVSNCKNINCTFQKSSKGNRITKKAPKRGSKFEEVQRANCNFL